MLPLASEWKSIGALLEIPKHTLNRIKKDEQVVRDCLREVLSEWIKQSDPPTWTALAEVAELFDTIISDHIRQRIPRS